MSIENMNKSEVHITTIVVGDAIKCSDGHTRTVCKKDIKKSFCGVSIFGDSFRGGRDLVTVYRI